jgi:hypothetical protein
VVGSAAVVVVQPPTDLVCDDVVGEEPRIDATTNARLRDPCHDRHSWLVVVVVSLALTVAAPATHAGLQLVKSRQQLLFLVHHPNGGVARRDWHGCTSRAAWWVLPSPSHTSLSFTQEHTLTRVRLRG